MDVGAKLPVTVFAATYRLQGRGEYGAHTQCRSTLHTRMLVLSFR